MALTCSPVIIRNRGAWVAYGERLMWPFGDTTSNKLTQEDAEYTTQGKIKCPRCDNDDVKITTLRMASNYDRTLTCKNCGYSKALADGVRLIINTNE